MGSTLASGISMKAGANPCKSAFADPWYPRSNKFERAIKGFWVQWLRRSRVQKFNALLAFEMARERKKVRERKGEKRVLGSMASPFKSSMPFGRSKWRGSVKVKKGEGAKKGFWVLGSELASGIKLKAIQILVNPRSQIRGIRVLKKERVRNGEGAIKRSGFSVSIRYYVESRYKSVVISVRQICFIRVLINLRER
jgi:hypothetical protein